MYPRFQQIRFFQLSLRKIFPVIGALLVVTLSLQAQVVTNDEAICNRIFARAYEQKLIERPIGEIITFVARQFLGAPYEAGTLDRNEKEKLVANLHSFDCVTLVENTLAIARCIKQNTLTFSAYSQELQHIRYRNGMNDGYTSRLHYFSDWIRDNARKNIVAVATPESGSVPLRKTINFMTRHRDLYKALRTNDSTFLQIASVEDSLNSLLPLMFLKKSTIAHHQSIISTGDILAITTNTPGLDISHTGFALWNQDGKTLHFLHASDERDKVILTEESLSKYLQRHSRQTGIIVVRPHDFKP